MKDKGVFACDGLNEVGNLVRESIAGIVKWTGYVSIVTPLVVPNTQSISHKHESKYPCVHHDRTTYVYRYIYRESEREADSTWHLQRRYWDDS